MSTPDGPVAVVLEALRARGIEAKRSGKGWTGRCPAHDDKRPSLSLGVGSDGKVLLKCQVGCRTEEIVKALGLAMKDLFPQGSRRGARPSGSRQSKPGSGAAGGDGAGAEPSGCTLARYADAKRLPLDFLRGLGLAEITYQCAPAVRIPYAGAHGSEGPTRFRTALTGPERFRWKPGSKLCLYGLDRLADARRAGYVVLVEGESDCHSLWFHGEPALGIAGAANWRDDRDAPHLENVPTIFVLREPDRGGDSLIARLGASSIRDRVRIVHLGKFKDPSELHAADPKRFAERWEKAKAKAVPLSEELAREQKRRRKELAGTAAELIAQRDILSLFAADLERAGVVGEARAAKLIYLCFTSRLLPKPVSAVVKGPSSVGKSYTTEQTRAFFPESACYELSGMSERALAYSEEPIKHRTLLVYEAAGLGEFGMFLLRTMLSEGGLQYETVEKTPTGELRARLLKREGPMNLILTTTAVRVHHENETRVLSIPTNDTPEQTAAVMRRTAEGGNGAGIDHTRWHALQDWLACGDNRVVVPFRVELSGKIPPIAVRLRRDFKAVLSLIQAHALLHQGTRGRDADGAVVATLADYAAVRELVADIIAAGVGAGVSKSIRETVAAVAALQDGDPEREVSLGDLTKRLKLDKSAASRRARTAVDAGYLENREDRRGRPARYVLGEPLPDDQDILPRAEVLQCCSVAGGIHPPSPPPGGADDPDDLGAYCSDAPDPDKTEPVRPPRKPAEGTGRPVGPRSKRPRRTDPGGRAGP